MSEQNESPELPAEPTPDGAQHQPEPQSQAAPETPKPEPRPRPQYGEMAPAGWQWQAPTDTAHEPTQAPAQGAGAPAADAAETTKTLAGVPHNLGIRYDASVGSASQTPAEPSTSREEAAPAQAAAGQRGAYDGIYGERAETVGAAVSNPADNTTAAQPQAVATPPTPAATQAPKGDRFITYGLLFVGLLSALTFASSMMQLPASINMVLAAAEQNTVAPDWVRTTGVVTAFGMLACWVAAFIISQRRIKRRKLSFWVPLVIGLIAIVAVFTVSMVTMLQVVPAEVLQDPTLTEKLLQNLQQTAP